MRGRVRRSRHSRRQRRWSYAPDHVRGRLLSAWSLSGRRRGRPRLPLRTGGMASSVGASIMLSCWLAGPISTPSGVPRASTTRWRLLPGLPLSVGLGPVAAPPFLLAQWRCPGWHGASRPAPRRASAPTRRGAAPPRPRHPANHASAASNSSPSRTPSRRAASSRAGPNAARTGCRSGPPGFRSAGVHSSGAAWAVAAREQSRAKDRQKEAVGPCHPNAPQPVLLGALDARRGLLRHLQLHQAAVRITKPEAVAVDARRWV